MVDVLYRKADGKGTKLYARVPTLPLAIQQFKWAVQIARKAKYTMIWIAQHEREHTWIEDENNL